MTNFNYIKLKNFKLILSVLAQIMPFKKNYIIVGCFHLDDVVLMVFKCFFLNQGFAR